MKQINLPFKRKKIVFWLFITCFLITAFVVWLVFFSNRNFLDQKIFNVIAPYISETRTRLMTTISFLSNHKFLIPANIFLIALFLFLNNRWEAIRVTVISLSSLGLMSLLKNLIQRDRPPNQLVEGITNFSFPSGHAMMSVAFYGLLIWWASKNITNKLLRNILVVLLLLLILMIGFSRIYLRVHYITDVIAGLCIGTIWLITLLAIMDRIKRKFEVRK